jgi:hypothetical protein
MGEPGNAPEATPPEKSMGRFRTGSTVCGRGARQVL